MQSTTRLVIARTLSTPAICQSAPSPAVLSPNAPLINFACCSYSTNPRMTIDKTQIQRPKLAPFPFPSLSSTCSSSSASSLHSSSLSRSSVLHSFGGGSLFSSCGVLSFSSSSPLFANVSEASSSPSSALRRSKFKRPSSSTTPADPPKKQKKLPPHILRRRLPVNERAPMYGAKSPWDGVYDGPVDPRTLRLPWYGMIMVRPPPNWPLNRHLFHIPMVMNKVMVKNYLEQLYGVTILKVEIAIVPGRKYLNLYTGRARKCWTKDIKRAIVTTRERFKYPNIVEIRQLEKEAAERREKLRKESGITA